jgi:hypothetical protein
MRARQAIVELVSSTGVVAEVDRVSLGVLKLFKSTSGG